MTVTLHARSGGRELRLNNLQVQLVAGALLAVEAPDRDLFAPRAYVPSHVCTGWSDLLFPRMSELVLVEAWDPQRAQLRPRAVVRVPSAPEGRRKKGPPRADPYAGLPPYAERTPVVLLPFGALVLSLASWLGTCGGCTVDPG